MAAFFGVPILLLTIQVMDLPFCCVHRKRIQGRAKDKEEMAQTDRKLIFVFVN